jgi:hypothetical protein
MHTHTHTCICTHLYTSGYVFTMYIKYKLALFLDIICIPNISLFLYADIPMIETLQVPSVQGKEYLPCIIR